MRNLTSKLMTLLAVLLIAALMAGCNQDSSNLAGPDQAFDTPAPEQSFDKKKKKNRQQGPPPINWPLVKTQKFRFNRGLNQYRGGSMEFADGHKSKFSLEDGALTPPANIPWGNPVWITMEVDYDSVRQELLFTFGPHGSQFAPGAQIKLDYSALGINLPNLYYIDDNGNYIPQRPDQIDTNKKWIKITVDHFSRYALARA